MFWVATAPLDTHGHVNVSPKGVADCFHVVNSKQVWYEDLTGSGVETISHVKENGRITIMFSAFEGPPRILRLFGVGTVHEYGTPQYNKFIPPTSRKPGSRSVIFIDVYQVGSSCGYGVPLYDFAMHRTQLQRFAIRAENNSRALAASRDQQGVEKVKKSAAVPFTLDEYWLAENMRSVDGLTGLVTAPDAAISVTPQSEFNEATPRPKMCRDTRQAAETARDRKWLASGFVLGAVSVLTISKLAGSLNG